MYNLRSLEAFHLEESLLTEKHLSKAQEQIEETHRYILPIAEKYGLGSKLLADIKKVETRAYEIDMLLRQRKIAMIISNGLKSTDKKISEPSE